MVVGLAGCGGEREQIEATFEEISQAATRGDGEAFVRLLAPESFAHYDTLIQMALNGKAVQVAALPLTDRAEIVMMRNRMTRKELSAMDGRSWLVHAVRNQWYGGALDEDVIYKKRFTVRGTTADVEVVYEFAWALFSGQHAGERMKDHFTFIKVEDRWLLDYRRPATLFEQVVQYAARTRHLSVEQVLERMESEDSGKPVGREIWEPMKK